MLFRRISVDFWPRLGSGRVNTHYPNSSLPKVYGIQNLQYSYQLWATSLIPRMRSRHGLLRGSICSCYRNQCGWKVFSQPDRFTDRNNISALAFTILPQDYVINRSHTVQLLFLHTHLSPLYLKLSYLEFQLLQLKKNEIIMNNGVIEVPWCDAHSTSWLDSPTNTCYCPSGERRWIMVLNVRPKSECYCSSETVS